MPMHYLLDQFCFPAGLQLSYAYKKPESNFFVLTEQDGTRLYGKERGLCVLKIFICMESAF